MLKNEDANSSLGKGLRSCNNNKIPGDAISLLLGKMTQRRVVKESWFDLTFVQTTRKQNKIM